MLSVIANFRCSCSSTTRAVIFCLPLIKICNPLYLSSSFSWAGGFFLRLPEELVYGNAKIVGNQFQLFHCWRGRGPPSDRCVPQADFLLQPRDADPPLFAKDHNIFVDQTVTPSCPPSPARGKMWAIGRRQKL